MRVFVFALFVTIGCGGPAGSTDAGLDGSRGCRGVPDGEWCGAGSICVDEECVASRCGDGFLDSARGELCDDGNEDAFDGCEPTTCVPTCSDAAADCDDGDPCSGTETCDGACHPGAALDDGAACATSRISAGVCHDQHCVEGGCNNGVLEDGEICDDGDDDPDDGCTPTCELTCSVDEDCQDATVCNGLEVCDPSTHTCSPGLAPAACDDGSACTVDRCDPTLGCVFALIDEDGDGHAPDTIAVCGDDCDDGRGDVFTGAEELCDGRDNDCDGDEDEISPTWYVDCDGDGAAASVTVFRVACTEPPPESCGGGWTTMRPVNAATTDCDDLDPTRFPRNTEVIANGEDENCDGHEICYLDADDDGHRRPDGLTHSSADSDCQDSYEAEPGDPADDCCDEDPRAFPMSGTSSASPVSGCGGFDYDCDGHETLELTAHGLCSPGTCAAVPGWLSVPPACGVSGVFLYGCRNPPICTPPLLVAKSQRCH